MIGSAIGTPRPTTTALAMTPSETKPSTRAWFPSAISAQPHLSRDFVSDEPNGSGRRQRPEVRGRLRVKQTSHCLIQGDARRDEDCEDDEEAGDLLAARAAEIERDSERYRRQGVADVVNQVG